MFFDDLNYSSSSDPVLLNFGWSPRSGGGGPGIGTWDPTHITFLPDPADSSNQLMQMAATTSGTAGTTIQTEILTPCKFPHGTFAARVKFEDAPESGPDGDQLYQTLFTISAYKSRRYGEIDFEYQPNGYGSVKAPRYFLTLWQTTHKSVSTNIADSYSRLHTLVVDDAEGVSTHFYVDGVLVTLFSVYYPAALMAIDFNQWYPTGSLVNSSTPRSGWNRSIGCITPKIPCLRRPRSRSPGNLDAITLAGAFVAVSLVVMLLEPRVPHAAMDDVTIARNQVQDRNDDKRRPAAGAWYGYHRLNRRRLVIRASRQQALLLLRPARFP